MKARSKATSSRTTVRGFRITHTQSALLDSPSYKSKASTIVRVLLQLYFNKRIPGMDALIEAEEKAVAAATEKNLLQFREMLKNQGQRKREEKNGTNSSGI